MNLKGIREAHPDFFYKQDWFEGHAFYTRTVRPMLRAPTDTVNADPADAGFLPHAAALAWLYVNGPRNPIWKRYIWTADLDDLGQRVYVGDNGRGLEIHRHLHLTERWGIPVWD